jgi:hypothetical protein
MDIEIEMKNILKFSEAFSVGEDPKSFYKSFTIYFL